MRKNIKNASFGQERALYGSRNLRLENVRIDGPEDGESAIKECRNIEFVGGYCNLRYPFWHVHGLKIEDTEMTELCRAALWYTKGAEIKNSDLNGIKAVRECDGISLIGCRISSPEFAWLSKNLNISNCEITSEYLLFQSKNIAVKGVNFTGKYSFQYIKNAVIEDSVLNTKDAFWHGENITVKNCEVNGEYLGWYSKNLTFIDCRISGTQPLCYCKGLKLIDCTTEGCDLSFEKSDVTATLLNPIVSVKNPYSGKICAPGYGEIITDDRRARAEIIKTDPQNA